MYIGVNLDLPGMNIDEYFQNNNQIIEIWVVAYFDLKFKKSRIREDKADQPYCPL